MCGNSDLMYSPKPRYYDNLQAWDFRCMDCNAEGYEEHILTYQGTMVGGGTKNDTYYEEGAEIEVKQK
jgi:hypothetical protein